MTRMNNQECCYSVVFTRIKKGRNASRAVYCNRFDADPPPLGKPVLQLFPEEIDATMLKVAPGDGRKHLALLNCKF